MRLHNYVYWVFAQVVRLLLLVVVLPVRVYEYLFVAPPVRYFTCTYTNQSGDYSHEFIDRLVKRYNLSDKIAKQIENDLYNVVEERTRRL